MSIGQVYDYVEGGFRVFALWGIKPDGTCACPDPECIAVGKHPRINGWNNTPFQDDEQIEAMQEFLIDTGFGVCLDSHLVIDIDPRNGGFESYEKLKADLGIDLDAESRCIVDTGGGGHHVYFKLPPDTKLMGHHRDYPGIDFKGAGGFVVGAGSLHASGAGYEFGKGNPCDIDLPPQSLIDLLKKAERKHTTYEGEEVTDNEIRELLKYIQNDDLHYDDWIKVGMAIHDATGGEGFGLWDEWSMSSGKYCPDRMDNHWHSFGKSANPVRIGTLFHWAETNGFVREVTFDAPIAPISNEAEVATAAPKPKHVRMLDALQADDDSEMARVANMQWLIDGLIPAESFGVFFGEPGCGKSFTMVDAACSVASGTPWQGLDTGDEGVVIYISAEGGNGMRFRKRAWEQKRGVRAPLMRVLPMTTIMDDPKDVGLLSQVLREYTRQKGVAIKMLIVDTLNRSMAGNENDNSDMANFIRGCEQIQQEQRCGVVVVHHSGKDAEKGARGASALKAATDFEVMVAKKEDIITVSHTRSKDTEPLKPVLCKAEVVTIDGYTDYKGRPITSLVPMPASFADSIKAAGVMSERESVLIDVIRDLCGDTKECQRGDAREAFKAKLGLKDGAARQAFSSNLGKLRERGMIEFDAEIVELTEF